jgi:hypothetical protein
MDTTGYHREKKLKTKAGDLKSKMFTLCRRTTPCCKAPSNYNTKIHTALYIAQKPGAHSQNHT